MEGQENPEIKPDAYRKLTDSELLKDYAPRAGKFHIAAPGMFRTDNPMFSSPKLGDSWLNFVDIFNLKLLAGLTTLSACEAGMSALYEGLLGGLSKPKAPRKFALDVKVQFPYP